MKKFRVRDEIFLTIIGGNGSEYFIILSVYVRILQKVIVYVKLTT